MSEIKRLQRTRWYVKRKRGIDKGRAYFGVVLFATYSPYFFVSHLAFSSFFLMPVVGCSVASLTVFLLLWLFWRYSRRANRNRAFERRGSQLDILGAELGQNSKGVLSPSTCFFTFFTCFTLFLSLSSPHNCGSVGLKLKRIISHPPFCFFFQRSHARPRLFDSALCECEKKREEGTTPTRTA
ncbi:MAG: hypothetical protein JOS17DRAFT_759136 [Linnemannia elongata]|nr:MAG: hypothetical protein JOS17DRAFT_759136 [Linnemannia elongata]